MVAELTEARSRKVHLDLLNPATAECSIDGRSPQMAQVQELSQDLVFYRFDQVAGGYRVMFRGPFGHSVDTVSETTHTVALTSADYQAMLNRMPLAAPHTWSQLDQGWITYYLLNQVTSGFPPGSMSTQGLQWGSVYNPDGTVLASVATGVLRDRTYTGAEKIGDAVNKLSQVINGFDWEITPVDPLAGTIGGMAGTVNLWYPQRGTNKTYVAEYGGTVEHFTRVVDSTDFANWVRMDGQQDADGNPIFAISTTDILNNPQLYPEGLWQAGESLSPDTSQSATLQQQADGWLAFHSQIVPSYSLTLRPGAWISYRDCWLGDAIEVRLRSGRLNVDTAQRILAIDFDIDDNGVERISLTVGRTVQDYGDITQAMQNRLDALSRR